MDGADVRQHRRAERVNRSCLPALFLEQISFENVHSQNVLRRPTAQANSSAVFATAVGEPASLANGDNDCRETGRSLHMLPASAVSCVTISEHPQALRATAEAAPALLRRASAHASARAISRKNCSKAAHPQFCPYPSWLRYCRTQNPRAAYWSVRCHSAGRPPVLLLLRRGLWPDCTACRKSWPQRNRQ